MFVTRGYQLSAFSCVFCSLMLLSLRVVIASSKFGNNVADHLARRLRETKIEIAKEYVKRDIESGTVVAQSYDVKWENLWSRQLQSERALTISMFNKMFILEGNRVMSVAIEPATYSTNDTKNFASLHQVASVRKERSVKFVKSIVWKSRLYLLICHEDACNLYTGINDFHLRHGQIIKPNEGLPIDAIFFTRTNRLYLIVAHSRDEFPVSSIIYHWTGTYMDIINQITTIGAISVTAFNHRRSTIIVFGQSERMNKPADLGSEVYEFNENNEIVRIQYLSTNGPTAIHHYHHRGDIFILITKKREASSVYWWDGNEFFHWLDLPDIVAPNIVKIIRLHSDTLFFVAYQNSVCLYRVTSSEYSRLDLLELKKNADEKLIDIGVWIDKDTAPTAVITLLLITVDLTSNLYRVEPWEMKIEKNRQNNAAGSRENVDATEKCLSTLYEKLEDRMVCMENLTHRTWPMLVSSEDDINTMRGEIVVHEQPITADRRVILKSRGIEIRKIDILSCQQNKDSEARCRVILLPNEIRSSIVKVNVTFSSILDASRKMLQIHANNRLTGDVIVNGDTKFHQVFANSIRTSSFTGSNVNCSSLRETLLSATKIQSFSKSQLLGKSITVRHLEIDELCGIPQDYWLILPSNRANDDQQGHDDDDDDDDDNVETRNDIFTRISANDNVSIEKNETVFIIREEISLSNLDVCTIENVDIPYLFNNLFIPGEIQLIKGNILQRTGDKTRPPLTMNVENIAIEELNGISKNLLINRVTDQNIRGSVWFNGGKILMQNLTVTRINGIAIEDCAVVAKKNHITGKISLSNLRILNQMKIEDTTKFPTVRPVQVYKSVTVFGNIMAKDVALASLKNEVFIGESGIMNFVPSALDRYYWTKSTSQTLKNRVCFDAGVSIDELRLNLLNKIDINEDIMLTSMDEIKITSGSLEFANFMTSASIMMMMTVEDETRSNPISDNRARSMIFQMLYDDSSNSLLFNEEIRIERLGVQQLYIESFNGILIDAIMSKNSSIKYTEYGEQSVQRFDSITVNDRLEVENLYLTVVNAAGDNYNDVHRNKEKQRFDQLLRFDGNYSMHNLKTKNLILADIEIKDDSAAMDEKINANNYSKSFTSLLTRMKNWHVYNRDNTDDLRSNDKIRWLIIDGDAKIESEDAAIGLINNKNTLTYVDELATEEIFIETNDRLIIDSLTVYGDLKLNFLRGSFIEKLSRKTLSKSRPQNLSNSTFLFFGISIVNDDLRVERINDRQIDTLIHVDANDINFIGDVIFENLTISSASSLIDEDEPHIKTNYLNGYRLNEQFYEMMGNISTSMVEHLIVQDGSVSWQNDDLPIVRSMVDKSLGAIMKYGLCWRNPPIIEDSSKIRDDASSTTGPSIIGSDDFSFSDTSVFLISTKRVDALDMTITNRRGQERMKERSVVDGGRVSSINVIDIENILTDSVLDDENPASSSSSTNNDAIRIKGDKSFGKNVETSRLSVHGNIDVPQLKKWRVDDLNSSIVQINYPRSNFNDNKPLIRMIFRNGVEIRKLVILRDSGTINDIDEQHSIANLSTLLVHGLPIDGIFTVIHRSAADSTIDADYGYWHNYLPNSTHFKHLSVRDDAFVESLDSVKLDEFINDRVDILSLDDSSPIRVNGNVQFNGRIGVSDITSVRTINDIDPLDLVINDSSEYQIIDSVNESSVVEGDIVINGETYAFLVAGIDLTREFENAVLGSEDVTIHSDTIFQADVEQSADYDTKMMHESDKVTNVESGFVNDANLRSLIKNRDTDEDNFARNIVKSQNDLETIIARAWNASMIFSGDELVYYLEPEKNLTISGATAGTERLEITKILGETTYLALHANVLGSFCDLPEHCPCRMQHIVEISNNNDNCHSWKAPRIFFNFHEANGGFAVSVATTTVSSSERCVKRNGRKDDEFTTISWMKHQHPSRSFENDTLGSNFTKDALKIYGYLSDVAVSTQNNLIFIALAIYYDPINSSHRTNSLIYALDLATDSLALFQTIPMSHAIAVEAFKIPNKGLHLLFSSAPLSPSLSSNFDGESLLYRLETRPKAEFRPLTSFPLSRGGGNRRAKNVKQSNEEFLFLDYLGTNSIGIYRYDAKLDYFYHHQSIYHDSMVPVTTIETLYTGVFPNTGAHVIVTTERDQFFIYEYTTLSRTFQLVTKKRVDGILSMVPFDILDRRYVFVGTDRNSSGIGTSATTLRIVEQGYRRWREN